MTLKEYMEEIGAKPVSPVALEPFLREMEERTIPAIIERERRQAELCAEARRWILT